MVIVAPESRLFQSEQDQDASQNRGADPMGVQHLHRLRQKIEERHREQEANGKPDQSVGDVL